MGAKYDRWLQRVVDNGCKIEDVKELAVVKRSGFPNPYVEVYDTKLITPEGGEFPRVIVVRGDSVLVIPVLKCKDDGEYYTVLAGQRRITDGSFNLEFVGGMIDGEDSILETCVREVQEEVGIEIQQKDVQKLLHPVSLCTSLLDEKIAFCCFVKELTKSEIDSLHHKETGLKEENEYIKTIVMRMKDILESPNVSNNTLFGTLLVKHKLDLTF